VASGPANASAETNRPGAWMSEPSSGSRDGLRQLLQGCRQYLLMVANHAMTPDLQAKVGASDIVQETFLEAHQHLGRFRGSTRPELLAWLRRILECRLSNIRRAYCATDKRAVARESPLVGTDRFHDEAPDALVSPTPSPSNHAIRSECARALEQALGRLPDHYRQAVVLRHQEQLAFSEIGQRLNCSTEAARKLWNRAIHQLRLELEALA
jgi:RNA polymerase sigma-70 factor (ECF subfamily)